MLTTIDLSSSVQRVGDPITKLEYPRQVVLDLGRSGLRYSIEMRDLIHWTAYRLDTGAEGMIANHRTAVALRSICEYFYPYQTDEADELAEGLGIELSDELSNQTIRFDPRLLGLVDEMVYVDTSFAEMLWTGQAPHAVLAANAANTLDFEFPLGAYDATGIRGVRVAVNDLVNWLLEGENSAVMPFLDEASAIDELVAAESRASAFANVYTVVRRNEQNELMKARHPAPAPSAAEQDEILKELSALI